MQVELQSKIPLGLYTFLFKFSENNGSPIKKYLYFIKESNVLSIGYEPRNALSITL